MQFRTPSPTESFIMKKEIIRKLLVTSILAFSASGLQAIVVDSRDYASDLKWITSSAAFYSGIDTPSYVYDGFTTPKVATSVMNLAFSATSTPVSGSEPYTMLLAGLSMVGTVVHRRVRST